MTHGKTKIVLPLVLFFTILTSSPKEARPMGVPIWVHRTDEIHRLCPGAQVKNQTPKMAPTIDARVYKITFVKYRELPVLLYITNEKFLQNVEVSKLIKKIRGGGVFEAAVALFLIIFLYQIVGVNQAFVPNNPNTYWGLDRPNPYQPPSVTYKYPSILNVLDPRRTSPSDRSGSVLLESRLHKMCPIQRDENGFVMSYNEAYKLVEETYTGYIDVNEVYKITDWQSAKHIYHAPGMGINPADYGFTQKDLERIRGEERYKGGGLIAYARRGYPLPPIEMVRAYSEKLKERCGEATIRATKIPFYDVNGKWSTTVYLIPPLEGEKRGIMIVFNESTKDLITGDKQRRKAFTRLEEEGFIGSPKWMMKWNNSTIGPTPAPACEFSSLAEGQNSGFTPLSSFDSDVRGVTPLDSSSSNF